MSSDVEQYKAALEQAEIKLKGKNNLYTSHNGHMFSFVMKEGGIAVRLSKDDKEAYEDKYGTGDVIQHNSVMNGYVPVVEGIVDDVSGLCELIQKGFEFVDGLPPK